VSTSIGVIAPVIMAAGRDLKRELLNELISMRVERGLGLAGRATLRFLDGGYQISAGDTFALGKEITIKEPAGVELFSGTVTGIDLDQRRRAVPELVVVVDDGGYKLARGTQIKTYLNTSYSEVIRQIANRHGLTPNVDSTRGTFEYLLQNGNDLAFLNSIAERAGLAWWVDGRNLHVAKVPDATLPVTVTLGTDLYEFSVRASGLRPTAVELNGWNADTQKNVQGTNAASGAHTSDLVKNYLGTKPASALTAAPALLADPPPLTVDEANTIATGLFADAEAAAVVAEGVGQINGRIKPGGRVKIADTGPASGTYVVTQVEHVYDRNGFETRFTCGSRRPASIVDTLRGPSPDPSFLAAVPVIGVITDNNDPSGRVKVKYSGVGGEIESPWARVVSLGGGASRGVIFVPEVGDEVLVAFERGDTRRPVVIGGLFSEKNKLPTAGSGVTDGKVEFRRMISRKNHIIEIADGEQPNQQHVLIKLGTAEHLIRVGADRFDIEVAEGKPLTIKAGKAMFDINAGGNISIEGKNVTIKADANLLLQGGSKAVLESNAQTQVTGGQLQVKATGVGAVEAGGPLTLKGATVAIN
jgi:uncharacterized protein involved in type VI secretion and phage assembly